jgi:hypothetical protein
MQQQPSIPRTIHYTELPPAAPGTVLATEWETYRREVGRLIAEGHEGKHVLIHDDQILGLFATHDEALKEGHDRYLLSREPFMVKLVLTNEPLLRTRVAA